MLRSRRSAPPEPTPTVESTLPEAQHWIGDGTALARSDRSLDELLAEPPPVALELRDSRAPRASSVPPPRASVPSVSPRDAIVAFAGFGRPPSSLWSAPGYAMRALGRRRRLQEELAVAKHRRRSEVDLYRAALDTFETGPVVVGLTLMAGAATVGFGLVFGLVAIVF